MTTAAVVLASMLTIGGIVLILAWSFGVVGVPGSASFSTGLWTKVVDKYQHIPRRTLVLTGVSTVAAVLVTVWTGWPLMLVVVPLAVVGLPHLLSAPRNVEIELLGALDRWVRGMTATMATGKSITDALRLSARQAPPELSDSMVLLVRRLDDRWTPSDALRALADELDSADADTVIASLILAVQRGGSGAIVTLAALADSVQERLRALREVEAERAKPRAVVRHRTIRVPKAWLRNAKVTIRGCRWKFGHLNPRIQSGGV
ncbi:type II secretion system F family protein [Propioniciclava soli]|uniref:Type II secretion system F family protein n=1 Tax=Propioniciclava soli TaxID=2775081 RepID=A0ABZ3C9G5_9ACTN